MDVAPLFADPKLLRLERVRSKLDGITLIVKTAPKPYLCPQCHQHSTHLHNTARIWRRDLGEGFFVGGLGLYALAQLTTAI
jgi:transposase